jgi:Ca2+-binding EF-hand superfamily protein
MLSELRTRKLNNKYALRWITMRADIKEKLGKKIDYQIHLNEWLDYYDSVSQDEAHRREVASVAELIFDIIDLDESGNLDRNEWTILFQVFNIPVVYVSETFDRIDRNHDGLLSKEEFLPLLEEFYYSDDPNATGNGIFGPI